MLFEALDELEKLCESATDGWVNDSGYRINNAAGETLWEGKHFDACGPADMAFCEAARKWLLPLIQVARDAAKAETKLEKLQKWVDAQAEIDEHYSSKGYLAAVRVVKHILDGE